MLSHNSISSSYKNILFSPSTYGYLRFDKKKWSTTNNKDLDSQSFFFFWHSRTTKGKVRPDQMMKPEKEKGLPSPHMQ